MPIAPHTFDEAFKLLGVDLVTSSKCSWENYELYNASLTEIQGNLSASRVPNVTLLDAHSFCWILVRLPLKIAKGGKKQDKAAKEPTRKRDPGHHLNPREMAIAQMRQSVLNTVKQSTEVEPEHQRKLKELRMSQLELDEYIRKLMDRQEDRCALTGLGLQ